MFAMMVAPAPAAAMAMTMGADTDMDTGTNAADMHADADLGIRRRRTEKNQPENGGNKGSHRIFPCLSESIRIGAKPRSHR